MAFELFQKKKKKKKKKKSLGKKLKWPVLEG